MSSQYCRKVSLSRVRKPTPDDAVYIYCRVLEATGTVPDSEITRLANVKYAVEQIYSGEVQSAIVDDAYLVVYGIGSPWYTTDLFLEELMVLRLWEGSSFQAVCDLLDDLAHDNGATEIMVGGALARYPKALVRMYKARGYKELDIPALIKRR